jgi:hypothetical protein
MHCAFAFLQAGQEKDAGLEHLGGKGSDIWAEAISGKVKELLGEANSGGRHNP